MLILPRVLEPVNWELGLPYNLKNYKIQLKSPKDLNPTIKNSQQKFRVHRIGEAMHSAQTAWNFGKADLRDFMTG